MKLHRVVILLMPLAAQPVIAQTAADEFFDPDEMAAARAELYAGHGAQTHWLILGERLEYQSNDGDHVAVWEGQGWIGGDIHKAWFKTEGEYETEDSQFEELELQALYSRAVSPFWDLQFGIRHDIRPEPTRTYAVIGAQGVAPYWFELDGSLFISDEGDVSARFEAEYELRLTQRLILQPRLEASAALSEDFETGVGSGLSSAEIGLRLRYEVRREIAPYVGVAWNATFGETADLRRAAGEEARQLSVVAGLRFWF